MTIKKIKTKIWNRCTRKRCDYNEQCPSKLEEQMASGIKIVRDQVTTCKIKTDLNNSADN